MNNNTQDEGIETSVDINWIASLKKKVLDTKFKDRNKEPTIFRVPDVLKKVDYEAYEPSIVSLGPYHHDKPHLQAMNQVKWKCLKYVLEQRPGMTLEDYVDRIRNMETQLRDAYSEEVKMDSNSFVEMMLLDGFFLILTIMQKNNWMTSWAPAVVVRDIFLLENQLPFFLLETLYEYAFPPHSSFRKLTLEFISDHLSIKLKLSSVYGTYHHIIHLFLSCIDPTRNHGIGNGNQSSTFGCLCINSISKGVKTVFVSLPSKLCSSLLPLVNKIRTVRDANSDEEDLYVSLWIPSATVCNEAGIDFVRKKRGKSLLDITFHRGKLEIPQLLIQDDTNTLLRNLIAYEQCSADSKFHVTSYLVFMDSLINTAADVELLQQHEIIFCNLGDNQEIATLFNKLCANVFCKEDDFYLGGVFTAIRKHRDARCNKWRAKLNRDYFSNPWAIISLFGALALFVLTLIQTTYAGLSYHP